MSYQPNIWRGGKEIEFNQSCLQNEAPVKSLHSKLGWWTPWLSILCMLSHTNAGRVMCPWGYKIFAFGTPLPQFHPIHLCLVLISIISEQPNFKYSTFLNSVIHSSELLLKMKVVVETPKFVASWCEVTLDLGTRKLVCGVIFWERFGGLKVLCLSPYVWLTLGAFFTCYTLLQNKLSHILQPKQHISTISQFLLVTSPGPA